MDRYWWGPNGRRPAMGWQTGRTTTACTLQVLSTTQLVANNDDEVEFFVGWRQVVSSLQHRDTSTRLLTSHVRLPLCATHEAGCLV